MSVPPPPPPPGSDLGGFFGGRAPVAPTTGVPTFGYPPPAYAGFGAPAVASPALTSGPATAASNGVPEGVVIAYTLLALYTLVAIFVGAALLIIGTAVQSDSPTIGLSSMSLGLLASGGFWLVCAAVDAALVFALRTGNQLGRIGASIVCALWAIYWLNQLRKLFAAATAASSDGLGSVVGLAELLLFVLALLAVAPGVLPWIGRSARHFD
jgi:hypothetical protein